MSQYSVNTTRVPGRERSRRPSPCDLTSANLVCPFRFVGERERVP
jgi:hypothetical protein